MKTYHLGATENQIGQYVFLAGDPQRIPLIATYFDESVFVTEQRGFVVYTGELESVRVSAVCTGIGGPSAAIVVEELISLGAHTFIRLGTCGSLQDSVETGDIVIANAAIRDEGTTHQYVSIEVPAVADPQVVNALVMAANTLEISYHLGLVHSKDSFYSEIPDFTAYSSGVIHRWNMWRRAGALATEMEIAAIYILSLLRKRRAGAALLVVGSTVQGDLIQEQNKEQVTDLINVGVWAMRHLIRQDKGERENNNAS